MGKVLFVSCTNVGKSMIYEIMNNSSIKTEICGIVNLNILNGAVKANYHTYADISAQYNIPIHYCYNVNDEVTLSWIEDKCPDIIIQTGWSQKFSDKLLGIPRFGCIGEHPAPLPKGRGAACVNWAILTGEKKWGDSFFEMVSEYDKGAIYAQDFFNIEEYDDVKTVYDKVALSSAKIIRHNIDNWSRGIFNKIPQNDSESTYYKRRTPKDGEFDLHSPAAVLHDFIRAQTSPYPCAFIILGKDKISVLSSVNTHRFSDLPCGTVLKTYQGGAEVVCGDGGILFINRIRVNDSIEYWAEDFIRERNLTKLV